MSVYALFLYFSKKLVQCGYYLLFYSGHSCSGDMNAANHTDKSLLFDS